MSDDFHAAAAYLSSTSSQTDTSTKLEIYSLFKVVTVSLDGPNTSRPSVFDLTGKAKWDAWKKASEQYQTVEQAESRYVEIAKGLGWTAGAIHVREQDAADSTGSQRGHGGMGFFVSTMAFSEEKDDKTVHGAAVDGNVAALQALIATADVNARDEYVGLSKQCTEKCLVLCSRTK